MDAAIIGSCHADYCRVNVYRDDWDRLLQTFKNVSAPAKMVVDGSAVKVDEGKWRVDVFIPMFDELKRQVG